MPDDDFLDLAKKYESGGRNILNYLYDPTHTAGGYWQITDTNWRAYAPKVGIDTDRYPTAISMKDEQQQRKVADYILNNTPKGIRNWTDYNPKLKAALEGHAPKMAQKGSANREDDSGITLQDIEDEIKRRTQLRMQANPEAYRSVFDPQGSPGTLEKWATESDKPTSIWQALGDVGPFGPALRAGTRAVRGYPAGNSRAYDLAKSARGLGETAAAMLPYGGAAESMLTRGAEEVPSLWQFTKPLLGSAASSAGARALAEHYGASPDTQDALSESAGILGGLGASAMRMPSGGGGGGNAIMDLLRSPRARALAGFFGGYRGRMAHELIFPEGGPEPNVTVGDIGTQGKGAAPQTKPLPKTTEEDELLKLGAMTDEQYLQHMKDNFNLGDEAAQIKLNGARARALRDAAKENAKSAPKSPTTIVPKPPQAQGQPSPPVTLPNGLKVQLPPQVQEQPNLFNQPQPPAQRELDLGLPPGQMNLPGMRFQPPPGPQGALAPTQQQFDFGQPPVGPPPQQMGLPFPQGAQQELPFNPPVEPPPAAPPPTAQGLTGVQNQMFPLAGQPYEYKPFTGTTMGKMATQAPLDLPVRAPGEIPSQREFSEFIKPEGKQRGFDFQTTEQTERNVRDLRDAIRSRPDIRVGKWRYNTAEKAARLSKRLGLKFTAKPEDFDRALELLDDEERARRPTPNNPGRQD